jgi:hypothetical protein
VTPHVEPSDATGTQLVVKASRGRSGTRGRERHGVVTVDDVQIVGSRIQGNRLRCRTDRHERPVAKEVVRARQRPARTRNKSGDVWWLSVLSTGESWHNLQHADPTFARHGVLRGQLARADARSGCSRSSSGCTTCAGPHPSGSRPGCDGTTSESASGSQYRCESRLLRSRSWRLVGLA